MAFVYEKIRDEDKEWVDFGRFEGLRGEKLKIYSFSTWVSDRENQAALLFIDTNAILRDEGYQVNGCGFLCNQRYLNFSVCYSEIEDDAADYSAKWFSPHFEFTDETPEQKTQTINLIKDALFVYTKGDKQGKVNCFIEF